jgi:hypothetical protein
MNVRLIHQFPPAPDNPRNSEGAFLRGKQGEILFAYSRYHGDSNHDHAACDIALTVSRDEGRSWSEPRIIAPASAFGTKNVMSVSAVEQSDGRLAFYFLIKENDFTTTLGRAISADGETFTVERCAARFPAAYYVVNNDRIIRLSDGRLAAPASYISAEDNRAGNYHDMIATALVSEDDGESFCKADFDFTTTDPVNARYGHQEPGMLEREDGSIYLWTRTGYGCQYESVSQKGLDGFFPPRPSEFTSPPSPLQIKAVGDTAYAVYNPIPRYNGRDMLPGTWGRTPIVLRKSTDGGRTFGKLNIIEDDPSRGYCYPAIFGTNDGRLLLAYCRGDNADGNTLCRLGIAEVDISSIE